MAEVAPPAPAGGRGRVRVDRSPFAAGVILLGLLAIAVGLFGRSDPVAALGFALLVAVVVDVTVARRTVGEVTLHLQGPVVATSGEPVDWVLQASGLRRPVVVAPATAPREPRFGLEGTTPNLVTLPPLARGRVHHLAIDLTASGPVGLYRAGRRELVSLPVPLSIGPPLIEVDIDWPTPRAVGFALVSGAPRGDELFRGVRPYVRGDERRRIHWPTTAHHGTLMVRECDGAGVVAIQVVVDTGLPGPLAEHVLATASAVCRGALSRGWQVHLVTLEASVPHPPDHRDLGSPFGPALEPVPVLVPQPEVRVRRVHTPQDVAHQLAAAAFGRPGVVAFGGTTCTIDPGGIRWS